MTDQARCELSDLLISECGCRVHKPEVKAETTVKVWFLAQFDSRCQECGDKMTKGDRIGRTADGEYVCEECGK